MTAARTRLSRIVAIVPVIGLLATVSSADAQPVPVTAEIPVVAPGGPGEPLDRRDPAVGMAADGRFAVAYVEDTIAGSALWVQRFDADGARVGARVSVAGGAGNLQSPALAMVADGRFVVAYERRATDGSEQHVEFRRFDANAVAQGAEVLPGPAASVDESAPDVGLADDGRVAVAWRNIEDVAGTNTWRLRYRAYGADGDPRFDERDASSEELYDQAAPSLAMAPDGRFVLTWERRFTFVTTREVPARRFGADGEPAGAVFSVFSGAVGGNSGNGWPAAGVGSSGAFLVAWQGATDAFDAGISARLLTEGGIAAGDPFRADEPDALGLRPSVAMDDDGTLFAAYECYNGCQQQVAYLREYAPGGTPRGKGVVVGEAISDGRIFPEVATDRKGRVVVAWAKSGASVLDAYVRRYNGTAPQPTADPAVAVAPVATITAPPVALACTADKLVLTDVFPLSGKVHLLGAGPGGSAGQSVRLISAWDGKQVALATVKSDLSFTATSPLPPKSLRSTNKARYVAKFGGQTSLALKFARRMYTTRLQLIGGSAGKGRITFAGSVARPLDRPIQPVTIVAAGSCSGIRRGATVARVKPSSRGVFSATFALPASLAGLPVVFLRAQTRVPKNRAGARTFPTYTLIRSVRAQ